MTTNVQLALIAVFAASGVGAQLMSNAGAWRDGAPAVRTVLATVCLLSMITALVMTIVIGPWWRVAITMFGGGVAGGVEAAVQYYLPCWIGFVNWGAAWGWVIVALAYN